MSNATRRTTLVAAEVFADVAAAEDLLADVGQDVLRVQHDLTPQLAGTTPIQHNPLAAFRDLYVTIRREICKGLGESMFRDTPFMNELDVNFANLYLQAL